MAVTKKAAKPSTKKTVWDKTNPVKEHKHLTPAQKAEAKTRAAKAGRPYPNMVDNMAVARKAKAGAGTTSPASKKKTAPKKGAASAKTKSAAAKKPGPKPGTRKAAAKK